MIAKYKNTLIEISALLLAALFLYTGTSKIIAWQETYHSLRNQVFAPWMVEIIFYTLPPIELITAFLLVIPKWRLRGIYLSLLMMAAFTAYIAIVMTGIFGRIPCTCGGVVSNLTWSQHLFFNLTFLSISVLAAYLCNHSPPHIPKHKVNLQK